jgi:hypothetical protein
MHRLIASIDAHHVEVGLSFCLILNRERNTQMRLGIGGDRQFCTRTTFA